MAEHTDTAPFVDVQDVRHSVITKPAIVHETIVPEYTTSMPAFSSYLHSSSSPLFHPFHSTS